MELAVWRAWLRGGRCRRLVPVAEIRTEETRRELERQGYQVPWTAAGFRERFPAVDSGKVCLLDDPDTPCFYRDDDRLFPLPLWDGAFLGAGTLASFLEAECAAYPSPADTQGILERLPEALGFDLLDVLERETETPELYELFREALNRRAYAGPAVDRSLAERMAARKTAEERQATLARLGDAPGETVTVYRGMGDKSLPAEEAVCWTLDPGIGGFFALWRAEHRGELVRGTIRKADVIEVLEAREEREVLLLPERVTIQARFPFSDWEAVEPWLARTAEDYHRFREQARYEVLPFVTASSAIHDQLHSDRVLFLSLLISRGMGGSEEDAVALSEAALYHDISRTGDGVDAVHGRLSGEMYRRQTPGADPVVLFLMEYHCRPDEEGAREARENPAFRGQEERVWKLLQIFKDADGLDRVRLGMEWMDVTQFRTPLGRRLPLVARKLYDATQGDREQAEALGTEA